MAIQLRPRKPKPSQTLSDTTTTTLESDSDSDPGSSSDFEQEEEEEEDITASSESESEVSSYPSTESDSAVDTSDLNCKTDSTNRSGYLATRLRNIQANKALLKSLDIGRASEILPPTVRTRSQTKASVGPTRKSNRLRKRSVDPDYDPSLSDLEEEEEPNHWNKRRKSGVLENSRKGYTIAHCPSMKSFASLPYVKWEKGSVFGSIPGIPVGALFPYRIDCSRAGVHKPTVAGIHGDSQTGCYSICVSGGYPEDIDAGDHIVFTGSGGRSLKGTKENPKNLRTAPQDHDMELNRTNQSLIASYESEAVIRVLRGPKSHFENAPIGCYRYDGLYKCTQYRYEKGKSGFYVYLFTLERLPDQPELTSLPRTMDDPEFQPIFQALLNYKQSRKSGSSATPPSSPISPSTPSYSCSSRPSSRSSTSTPSSASAGGNPSKKRLSSRGDGTPSSGPVGNPSNEGTPLETRSFSGLAFTPRGHKVVFGYKLRPSGDTSHDDEDTTPTLELKFKEGDNTLPATAEATVEARIGDFPPLYESTPITYFDYHEDEDSDHSTITPDTRQMLSEIIDLTPPSKRLSRRGLRPL